MNIRDLFELFAEQVCLLDPLLRQGLGHLKLLPLLVARDHVVELTEVKLTISVCVTSLTKKINYEIVCESLFK